MSGRGAPRGKGREGEVSGSGAGVGVGRDPNGNVDASRGVIRWDSVGGMLFSVLRCPTRSLMKLSAVKNVIQRDHTGIVERCRDGAAVRLEYVSWLCIPSSPGDDHLVFWAMSGVSPPSFLVCHYTDSKYWNEFYSVVFGVNAGVQWSVVLLTGFVVSLSRLQNVLQPSALTGPLRNTTVGSSFFTDRGR